MPDMPGGIWTSRTYTSRRKGIDMKLVLDPERIDDTYLGWEWVELISYGYDNQGMLRSVLCRVPKRAADGTYDGRVALVAIHEIELFEDLFVNYYEERPEDLIRRLAEGEE